MNVSKQTVFDRIQEIANQKEITIAELERKVGFTNGVIRKWKNSVPTADKLQKVAIILGTTMEYLLSGENELDVQGKILARKANNLSQSQLDLITSMIEIFPSLLRSALLLDCVSSCTFPTTD